MSCERACLQIRRPTPEEERQDHGKGDVVDREVARGQPRLSRASGQEAGIDGQPYHTAGASPNQADLTNIRRSTQTIHITLVDVETQAER